VVRTGAKIACSGSGRPDRVSTSKRGNLAGTAFKASGLFARWLSSSDLSQPSVGEQLAACHEAAFRRCEEFGPVLVEVEIGGLIRSRKHVDESSRDLCRGRPLDDYDSGDPQDDIQQSLCASQLQTFVHVCSAPR